MGENKKSKGWLTALLAAVILVLGLLWMLWSTGFFAAANSLEDLHQYIQQFAPYSHLVFFIIQLASIIIAPIPSNLTAAAGGLLFGTTAAFLLSTAATILGSVIVFQLSRTLGGPFVSHFISQGNLNRYGEVLRKKRDTFLLLAFLFPFFPDDLICIMAGLTQISFRRFLFLVVIGRPWGLLAAAAVGGSTLQIPLEGMVLLGLAGLVILILAMRYGDRFEDVIIEKLKHS